MIEVRGDGLSGCAAALALHARGLAVRLVSGPAAPESLTLVLNDVCLELLRTLAPELMLPGRPLRSRRVLWDDAAPRAVRSDALAISSAALRRALLEAVADRMSIGAEPGEAKWIVCAQGRPGVEPIAGGVRSAIAVEAEVGTDDAYLVEAVEDGWLMATPADGGGTLQAFVPALREDPLRLLDHMLRRSRLVAPCTRVRGSPRVASSAPRVFLPLARRGWIAVGRSAMRLDPISGEGSPFGLRTALLAAAVVADIERGRVPEGEALAHYRDRLSLTALAHFKACAAFYGAAFARHVGWREEVRHLAVAHAALLSATRPPSPDALAFRLGAEGLVRAG